MASKTKEAKLQATLNKMVLLSVEAERLARELYGPKAFLFEESNDLHVMSGDCDGNPRERQEFLQMTADGSYRVSGGAW